MPCCPFRQGRGKIPLCRRPLHFGQADRGVRHVVRRFDHLLCRRLKDNGGGVVIGSELEGSKVAKANRHLAAAGLSQFAEIRAGDALQTLRDVGGTVDLLFLDGWKLMYPDVLKLLMPSLRQGAVVLADDVTLFPDDVASYLDFVRDPANGFVTATLPLGDGIEYSVKL